ncbi:unnamed protein product [Rotaria magnacalcarata]
MSETEQLLSNENDEYSDSERSRKGNKIITKLFKQFRRKTNDNEYQKLDEDSNLANKQQNISFFQLFRFADRFDFILLSIGLIGVVLVSLCFSANLIIFGKLTAVFAEVSSSGKCQNQQHNVSFLTTSTNGCPFSINPNAKNYSHLYRFCNGHEFTNVALSASSVRSSHSQMMEYIYLLLIIASIQLVAIFLDYYTFVVFSQRQVAHISVHLFRSIIQRVCQAVQFN